jgi:hypothetical protein
MTTLIVVAVGLVLLALAMQLLEWLGAPGWIVVLPWLVPTAGTLGWNVLRPSPAVLTDDDDDSWIGYSLRCALAGPAERPHPAPLRAVAAVLLGAPIVWAFVVFGLLQLTGVF